MIKILSEEDQRKIHHRYRNSDLFRQWSGILCELERKSQEIDPVTLWFISEKCLERLREITNYRDEEIPYIFRDLIKECGAIIKDGETIHRHPNKAEQSAITIMCVMLTSLMNAVEKGHEDEDFDNKAMCVAIDRLLHNNSYYEFLMEAFFNRKIGNDGKKVIIKSCDPMNEASIIKNMDETAKQEMESMKNKVLDLTRGLRVYFKNDWEAWESVWGDICLDAELMQLLSSIDPKDNEWQLNEKMICNVIGMFLEIFKFKNHVSKVNSVLAPEKNRRDYISNHGKNGGSSAVFSDEKHSKVESIIKSKKTS
jgi:hypothetical protein